MPNDGTRKVVLVTGASSGIGALSVRALARAGHTVYAGVRQPGTRQLQHPRRLPPFLAPYFAAKAAMEALAVSYAAEVLPSGIDTAIVVPGAFPSGTNHFVHAGAPADAVRAEAYDRRHRSLPGELGGRLAALVPAGAEVAAVAEAVARLVAGGHGTRPLHTHVDPGRDGSEVVCAVPTASAPTSSAASDWRTSAPRAVPSDAPPGGERPAAAPGAELRSRGGRADRPPVPGPRLRGRGRRAPLRRCTS
ncbi:hypothetical protein [Streptomyces sp. NPDC002490]|uniref:hypothetical protein n=1 Tax=Streptomyces sp. NPDC002490 TaxID=3154416 RepID=UPI0033215EEF